VAHATLATTPYPLKGGAGGSGAGRWLPQGGNHSKERDVEK